MTFWALGSSVGVLSCLGQDGEELEDEVEEQEELEVESLRRGRSLSGLLFLPLFLLLDG